MGMREDKHVDMKLKYNAIPLAPWLPKDLAGEIRGLAEGDVHWKGTDQTIEASSGEGEFSVTGGELIELPVLEFLAAATARKSLKTVTLTECEVKFRWKYPRFEVYSLDLTGEEKVSIRGSIVVNKNTLSGEIDLGLAPTYLDWLPRAKEEIFTRQKDGLIWTKVKLSGTLKDPVRRSHPAPRGSLEKRPRRRHRPLLRGVGNGWSRKSAGGNRPDS